MSKSLKGRKMSSEEIAHDLALNVVRTGIVGYQQGNDYQISDTDIARYAFSVYDDCYPLLLELIEKE
jgi:hypothetical protein